MYKLQFDKDEMSAMSAVLKFMIKHFYKDDLDDEVYLQLNALRNKIANAKQE
tara:strand:+ start:1192 stop:1347 length:156 start_codon:yes stop_codon:yes gene_type:complete